MTIVQTETQWRVYAAEGSVAWTEAFSSAEDADTYLWYVQSTMWWQQHFPEVPRIEIRHGHPSDWHQGYSYAEALGELDGLWRITLHESMRRPLVLLHEVAHVLNATEYGDAKRVIAGHIVGGRRESHGEMFRAALCALADRYVRDGSASEMRTAYEHFELNVPTLEELVAARKNHVAMIAAHRQIMAEIEQRSQLRAPVTKSVPAGTADNVPAQEKADWIPQMSWGYWIVGMRRRPTPMISQRKLAEAISPVVPTNPRAIARLERLEGPPTDSDDLHRALACAAVLGVDPVYAATGLGLAPIGGNQLTLEQLEPVAPDWVDYYRHLEDLSNARPEVRGGVRID